MSTPPTLTLGMGFSGMGLTIFGYGTPATAGTQTGNILQQTPSGVSLDARLIDAYTRDYVIDSDGIIQGQASVPQQVFLALTTSLGSSVEANLGSQFGNIKTFDASKFQALILTTVQSALATLIRNNSIKLLSVIASQNVNGVTGNVTINYLDLTTNNIYQMSI